MIGREEKLFQFYHTNVNIDELLTEWLTQMLYSDLRKNIKVSTGRRISNSFFTYLRSLRKGSTSTKAEAATNLATNTLGVAATGTAAFTLIVGAAVAEAAAGAAFIIAISGPWAGVTVGLIGIALLAKSVHSNRESAHEALFVYCWNIVDDAPPTQKFDTIQDLEKAAAAAMKLLEEGRKQLEDQSRKYQLASDNLQTFHRDIGLKITQCIEAKKQYLASSQAVANAPKNVNNPNLQQVQMSNEKKFNELKEKINNDFNAASSVNGAIFEMVRRCQHYSEYIQAPHIISLYYQSSLAGNITQVSKQFSTVDFFKDMPNIIILRNLFIELDRAYIKFTAITI